MKTTLELPDDLLQSLKERAADEERSFKELVLDLLKCGVATRSTKFPSSHQSQSKPLPLIECGKPGDLRIDSVKVDQILSEQELGWVNASL